MYEALFRPRALRGLEGLHSKDRKRIVQKFRLLQKKPFFNRQLDTKKLRGVKKSWRLRVGKVRAIYQIDKTKKKISVSDIGYRGSIY